LGWNLRLPGLLPDKGFQGVLEIKLAAAGAAKVQVPPDRAAFPPGQRLIQERIKMLDGFFAGHGFAPFAFRPLGAQASQGMPFIPGEDR
jgi:hypothetical protein